MAKAPGPRVSRAQRDEAVRPRLPAEVWRDELEEYARAPKRRGRGGADGMAATAYVRRLSPSVVGGNYVIDNQRATL